MNSSVETPLNILATIQGEAKTVLSLINRVDPTQKLQTTIQIFTRVRYGYNRGETTYEFPVIRDGIFAPAIDALNKLWKQRALTDFQYEEIVEVIHRACREAI